MADTSDHIDLLDSDEQDAQPSDPGPDAADQILPEEFDNGLEEEEENDGLEIDDRQADEIRQIFGTTLPQYLQPVEEMIEQILSSEEVDAETFQALQGTLSSLRMAAGRMGFDEIVQGLEQLGERLEDLGDQPDRLDPRKVREAIISELLDLKDLAAKMGGEIDAKSGAPSETIFKALGGMKGLGRSVLQKLSAAGLVMVDQLRVARPDEIAAVTGLPMQVVEEILAFLARDGQTDDNVVDLPLDVDPLRAMLTRKLRAHVEAEAAIQEARAEIQRLRARLKQQRARLRHAEQRRDETVEALNHISGRLVERATHLGEIRLARQELTGRYDALAESLRTLEATTERLTEARRRLVRDQASLDEQLEQVVQGASRALRMAATGRRADNAPAAPLTRSGGSKR